MNRSAVSTVADEFKKIEITAIAPAKIKKMRGAAGGSANFGEAFEDPYEIDGQKAFSKLKRVNA